MPVADASLRALGWSLEGKSLPRLEHGAAGSSRAGGAALDLTVEERVLA
jgi:hypothetical protein